MLILRIGYYSWLDLFAPINQLTPSPINWICDTRVDPKMTDWETIKERQSQLRTMESHWAEALSDPHTSEQYRGNNLN